jgi:peptidyl-tRNA hydrolase
MYELQTCRIAAVSVSNKHQTKHNNGALLIKLLLDRWNMKQWSTARREEKASSKIKIKN